MLKFDVSEIFQFAIGIEENGEKFYRHAAKMTESKDTEELFNYLADKEIEHKKTFENLLSKIKRYESPESYPDEYFAYLRSYVDNIIFTKEVLDTKLSEIKESSSAIKFGIQQELDSILYYHEIKRLVPENQHNLIDEIIDEERSHYLKLSHLLKDTESDRAFAIRVRRK